MPMQGEITATKDVLNLYGLSKVHEYIQSKIAIGVIRRLELVHNQTSENIMLRVSCQSESIWDQVLMPEMERLADVRTIHIHPDSRVIELRCKLKDTPNVTHD